MINPEHYKSYRTDPTTHKVEVRNYDDLHTFFYISCNFCKLQAVCANEQHKREICTVARKAKKIFSQFIRCHVSGFIADEFYIYSEKHIFGYMQKMKNLSNTLFMKYMRNNVRD